MDGRGSVSVFRCFGVSVVRWFGGSVVRCFGGSVFRWERKNPSLRTESFTYLLLIHRNTEPLSGNRNTEPLSGNRNTEPSAVPLRYNAQ